MTFNCITPLDLVNPLMDGEPGAVGANAVPRVEVANSSGHVAVTLVTAKDPRRVLERVIHNLVKGNGDAGRTGVLVQCHVELAGRQELETVSRRMSARVNLRSIKSASSPVVTVSTNLMILDRISRNNKINSSLAFLGWSTWSEWSACNNDSERVRTRNCVLKKPNSRECQGEEREVKQCQLYKTDESLVTAGGSGIMLSAVVFLILVIVGLVAFIFYEKKYGRNKLRQMPHSPHYSVPNQYSSLPTKDVSGH